MVDGLWSEQIDPKYTKGHDPHVTHQIETKTNQQESDHQTTTTIGWPDRTEEKSSVERPRNARVTFGFPLEKRTSFLNCDIHTCTDSFSRCVYHANSNQIFKPEAAAQEVLFELVNRRKMVTGLRSSRQKHPSTAGAEDPGPPLAEANRGSVWFVVV